MKDLMDRILNWSGGSYVGLSTLTTVILAIAQFISGEPVILQGKDGPEIWIIHRVPEWWVAVPFGVFMVILTLYVAQKPVNTWIGNKGPSPPGG